MGRKRIFLTGEPGVGKTSVVREIVALAKQRRLSVGGMISSEVRSRGVREGFEIQDLLTDEKGTLAHIKVDCGPRLGKYRVSLHDLKKIGAESIKRSSKEADITIIDEVGPMELLSEEFRSSVKDALSGDTHVLGTIRWSARDPLIQEIRSRLDCKILEVTRANRNELPKIVLEMLLSDGG